MNFLPSSLVYCVVYPFGLHIFLITYMDKCIN